MTFAVMSVGAGAESGVSEQAAYPRNNHRRYSLA